MVEDLLQSIGQDFRDDFIYDITKANGSKIKKNFRRFNFGDKNNMSIIYFRHHISKI